MGFPQFVQYFMPYREIGIVKQASKDFIMNIEEVSDCKAQFKILATSKQKVRIILDGEDGIIDQDYSLNAGRYVGVVIEDDGMTEDEFRDTMRGLHSEFSQLNAEALKLQAEIDKNMKELFGED